MKLSDLEDYYSQCIIKRDCVFDALGLIGKTYDSSSKRISYLENSRYIDKLLESDIVGIVCSEEIANKISDAYEGGICIARNPRALFFNFHNYLAENMSHYKINKKTQIHETAVISGSAKISELNVSIGRNSAIADNVIIHEGVTIGNDVIIDAGSIIGAPAFYYFDDENCKKLVKSVGSVVIGDNVDIHSNVVICKGVLGGKTVIGDDTKLDSLVFVGHDTKIGYNCTVAANTTFGGGTRIGDFVYIGVSASFAPNVVVGNHAKISMGSVVTKDVADNQQVSGNFAIEHNTFINHIKNIK